MEGSVLVLGITGNIASGKSTVSKELARRGAVVVDADQLAREVVEAGSAALQKIVAAFGTEVLQHDGCLDRDKLGQMVFADVKVRAMLNRIVHPEIAERSKQRLQELQQRGDIPLIVYEAPLLFEVGAESRVDKVLVVKVDPVEQLRRLQLRDGLSEMAAKERMAAQMPQSQKIARADFVIDNSGRIEETLSQVELLWPKLVAEGQPKAS
ncbi:dephospho-CoA kinase [Desulfuromusa kysingii]|uniref:Dephospho-CoA kinase n=1 Tax=Desulfuromusa kysingii TaxID=37625 RepID=A0A1H3W217_9BACT|nr:dephospho-CoA kinase [Desulfuromusa kysingii]SDZ80368.1 dephospho-CoA kinase [Desulfuromusa kysingii]